MAIPESFLEELSARTDIVDLVSSYVALNKKGGKYWGLCPFHSEKTPSFSVSPDRQMYYCFGCHKGGGIYNFVMELEGLGFVDAVEVLAKRAGLPMPEQQRDRGAQQKRERLLTLNQEAARWFHANLKLPLAKEGAQYFAARGLSPRTITNFGLGFAPEGWDNLIRAMAEKGYEKAELLEAGLAVKNSNGRIYDRFRRRVMFPIIDVRGRVIGFGGRVLDNGTPKYLNSPDTPVYNKSRNLFALNLAKKTKQGHLILTEGYMDTIALHQAGFDCAVASLGTSLTEEHARLLSNYTQEVIISYDGDAAGVNAARRAIGLLEKTGIHVRVLHITGAKDPDEYIKRYGREAFQAMLEQSENHIDYRISQLKGKYDLTADDQKVEFLKEAAALVAALESPVEREVYGTKTAREAGLSPDAMAAEVKRLRGRAFRKAKQKEERQNLSPMLKNQPRARQLRYEDVPSGIAEEGVIRLLLKDAEAYSYVGDLRPEEFTSPCWGKVYRLISQRLARGEPCTAAALAAELTGEEMNLLAEIQEKPVSLANAAQAMEDYIQTIRSRHVKVDGDADLLAYGKRKRDNGGSEHE